MAVFPPNQLVQVITYNESGLGFLENLNCFVSTANTKFKYFNDNIPKNLGDAVMFELTPRMTSVRSLVANFQGANQRFQTIAVDEPASVSYAFSSGEFIFNARDLTLVA
jgi:hypothetical protein